MPRRSRPPPPRQPSGRGPGRPSGAQVPDQELDGVGWQAQRSTADGDFLVRTISGAGSQKAYRCPGCQQQIAAGVAHVVVWPVWTGDDDGGVARRRHWHTSCWDRRANRGGPGRLVW